MRHQPFAGHGLSGIAIKERRVDLDWLRVIAFWLLIYYHAAVAFLPDGIPMIQNDTSSLILQVMVSFLHQFRLGLLFLISGIGVSFALRHRNGSQFARERAVRLLVPLVFGVLVVVPPMVFLEKSFNGEFNGSFVDFYPAFFTNGVYPNGNLSWHHYWFIAYLAIFCALGWPVFAHFRGAAGWRQLEQWSRQLTQGSRLYLAIVPLAVVEIALRAPFPGFRDLIHDWASFGHWFLIFMAGFLLASSRPLLDRTQDLRARSLVLAIVASATLFAQFWAPDSGGFSPLVDGESSAQRYIWFCLLRVSNAWFWLLACLGYAGRYLQRPGRVLTYLNNAVYPLFCLHLTIVVAIEFVVIPLSWSILTKYLVISTGAAFVTLVSYELVWRRITWLRPLVGLKPGNESAAKRTQSPNECS